MDSYIVQQSVDNGTTWTNVSTVNGNLTFCTVSSMPTGVTTCYRVIAQSSGVNSPPSNIVKVSDGLSVTPGSMQVTLRPGEAYDRLINIFNNTTSPATLNISLTGEEIPIGGSNYSWSDSDTIGGPVYVWNDISTTGTKLNIVSDADDANESFTLSFSFPFYGNSFNRVYVCSNGFITFGNGRSDNENILLPNAYAPGNLIAAFWDDLYTGSTGDGDGGNIYYLNEADKTIIQFDNVARYNGSGTYTFQIVLYKTGVIEFYYKLLTGTTDNAIVGIQNANGSVGTCVSNNTPYLKNNLAIRFVESWVQLGTTGQLTVASGAMETLDACFSTATLTAGTYTASIIISSNTQTLNIPITLNIIASGLSDMDDSDHNELPDWWELKYFGSIGVDQTALSPNKDGLTNLENYNQQIDPINPIDTNGLPYWWELKYFSQIHIDPDADPDTDEISNYYEFLYGSDPLDYYNGHLPTLIITSGGDQCGSLNQFLPKPLIVQANYGAINAPLTFTVTQGGALLSLTNSIPYTLSSSVATQTDNSGNASVYIFLPNTVNNQSLVAISATYGTKPNTSTVSIVTTATTVDPTIPPPTNLQATPTSPTTVDLTWTSDPSYSTVIQESVDGGATWSTIATVSAGTTSYTATGLSPNTSLIFRLLASLFGASSPPTTPTPPVTPLGQPVLMGEQLSITKNKVGFATFITSNPLAPPKRYLVEDEYDAQTGWGNDRVPAWETITCDPITEKSSVTACSTPAPDMIFGGSPVTEEITTETFWSITGPDIYGIDYDSKTLSIEYTTDQLKANTLAALPAPKSNFTKGLDTAYVLLPDTELSYSVTKLRYKFQINKSTDPTTLVWDILFSPDDTSSLPIHTVQLWTGSGVTETPVNTIDPTSLNGGQNGTYRVIPIQLETVSFGGDKNYWELTSDDSTTTYSAPQWNDKDGDGNPSNKSLGEHNYAVAFTSNTKPKIGATFKITRAWLMTSIQFKATGPDGISIPPTAATVSGDEVTMPLTASTTPLPSTIKYYNKDDSTAFKLDWQISLDGGTTWTAINSTKHTVYMTLADPATSLRQESLFEIGCREANGKSGSATDPAVKRAITDAIWVDFSNRNVKRVDGTQLTYYNSYNTNVTDTPGLLAGGDGQCGSWAHFFLDVRKEQGISDTDDYVMLTPISGDGFIVQNWTFSGSGNSGNSNYPYMNLPATPFKTNSSYNWMYAEVTDASGIAGQGTANPASFFNNHQMVFINGQYYDPSYGIKHVNLQDIQASLAGFYVGPEWYLVNEPTVNLDLNGNGNKTDMGVNTVVYLFAKTPFAVNLNQETDTY